MFLKQYQICGEFAKIIGKWENKDSWSNKEIFMAMTKIIITILLGGYFIFCLFGIFKTKLMLPRPKEFYDEHTNGFLGYKAELKTDEDAWSFFRVVFTLLFFAGVVGACFYFRSW